MPASRAPWTVRGPLVGAGAQILVVFWCLIIVVAQWNWLPFLAQLFVVIAMFLLFTAFLMIIAACRCDATTS